jgi:hypothetical protein
LVFAINLVSFLSVALLLLLSRAQLEAALAVQLRKARLSLLD